MTIRGKRIALVGDSQAQGLEAPLGRLIAREGAELVSSFTRSGWSTARVVAQGRLPQLLRRRRIDRVVVVLGGNDRPRSLGAYRRDILSLVRQIERSGARVTWIGPAFSKRRDVERRHRTNAMLQRAILWGTGVRWIDSLPHTLSGHVRDRVHFTRRGYRRWATRIVSGLRPLIVPALLAAAFLILGSIRLGRGGSQR